MKFTLITTVLAVATTVLAQGQVNSPECKRCCQLCLNQVGTIPNTNLGNCWGNCAAYVCIKRCPNEAYAPGK
ncbi:hypothetical protein PspLS_12015 [Pyricularia sp. CBS 133598]|nr:hypothetical protein PspLS_12015 [Pyricularia sp. CBS 133598]